MGISTANDRGFFRLPGCTIFSNWGSVMSVKKEHQERLARVKRLIEKAGGPAKVRRDVQRETFGLGGQARWENDTTAWTATAETQ